MWWGQRQQHPDEGRRLRRGRSSVLCRECLRFRRLLRCRPLCVGGRRLHALRGRVRGERVRHLRRSGHALLRRLFLRLHGSGNEVLLLLGRRPLSGVRCGRRQPVLRRRRHEHGADLSDERSGLQRDVLHGDLYVLRGSGDSLLPREQVRQEELLLWRLVHRRRLVLRRHRRNLSGGRVQRMRRSQPAVLRDELCHWPGLPKRDLRRMRRTWRAVLPIGRHEQPVRFGSRLFHHQLDGGGALHTVWSARRPLLLGGRLQHGLLLRRNLLGRGSALRLRRNGLRPVHGGPLYLRKESRVLLPHRRLPHRHGLRDRGPGVHHERRGWRVPRMRSHRRCVLRRQHLRQRRFAVQLRQQLRSLPVHQVRRARRNLLRAGRGGSRRHRVRRLVRRLRQVGKQRGHLQRMRGRGRALLRG
jgi:hypothetical protein